MSLHRNDWLKILGGLGLAATGLGAAGIGPLAGMLGASSAAGAGAGATGAGLGAGELLGTGATAALGTTGAYGLGAGSGALAAGAASAPAWGAVLGPSLASQGANMGFSGLMGTPEVKSTTPMGIPTMDSGQKDPFDVLRMIQQMKQGRI